MNEQIYTIKDFHTGDQYGSTLDIFSWIEENSMFRAIWLDVQNNTWYVTKAPLELSY